MAETNFTIIRESGRTEFFANYDYFSILSNVHHEYSTAGRNWDRPNMLLMNGKIVITEGLSEIAWKYGMRNRELHNEIHKKIREEFRPEWEQSE